MVSCTLLKLKLNPKMKLYRQSTVTCTAVLKTNKLHNIAVLVKQHDHPEDQTAVPVEQCRQSIKRKASTTNDKSHQIFTFSAATAPNEDKARLLAADTVKTVLRRVRSADKPNDPDSTRADYQ